MPMIAQFGFSTLLSWFTRL